MSAPPAELRPPAARLGARRRIGVGVIGFGWLGQAHSRSLLRIPTLFADRDFDPELVVCSDPVPARASRTPSAPSASPRASRTGAG